MFQPVPTANSQALDAAGSKFQGMCGLDDTLRVKGMPHGTRAASPWLQSAHASQHIAAVVKINDVDCITHESRMNGGTFKKQQASIVSQRLCQHQASEP
jgi:hypothetical protein